MTYLQARLFPNELPDQGATSDDYLTPAWLFDRLGITFDLDVAAPPGGTPWLPAAAHYDHTDDGLTQPWRGRVWMNPPYSDTAPWMRRFIAHRHGIALVQHCRSRWHRDAWATADAICDPNHTPDGGLFRFWRDGQLVGVFMPVTLIAFGADCVDALRRVGPTRTLEGER